MRNAVPPPAPSLLHSSSPSADSLALKSESRRIAAGTGAMVAPESTGIRASGARPSRASGWGRVRGPSSRGCCSRARGRRRGSESIVGLNSGTEPYRHRESPHGAGDHRPGERLRSSGLDGNVHSHTSTGAVGVEATATTPSRGATCLDRSEPGFRAVLKGATWLGGKFLLKR